jgi:hypothetical protein
MNGARHRDTGVAGGSKGVLNSASETVRGHMNDIGFHVMVFFTTIVSKYFFSPPIPLV